ncbi:MAG: hypothetical protein K2O55_06350, partial [Alistipes sp.]|nr:hypothetical protein [Alistipes sp.]
ALIDFTFTGENADKFDVEKQGDTSIVIKAVGNNDSGADYTATLVASLNGTTLDELAVEQEAALAEGTAEVEFDLTSGYENTEAVTSITLPDVPVSIALSKATGSTDPAWYSTGTGVRTYKNNTITFSGATILKIEFTFSGTSYNQLSAEGYKGTTWTGESNNVVFTGIGTSRIQKIQVIYKQQ